MLTICLFISPSINFPGKSYLAPSTELRLTRNDEHCFKINLSNVDFFGFTRGFRKFFRNWTGICASVLHNVVWAPARCVPLLWAWIVLQIWCGNCNTGSTGDYFLIFPIFCYCTFFYTEFISCFFEEIAIAKIARKVLQIWYSNHFFLLFLVIIFLKTVRNNNKSIGFKIFKII